MLRRLLSHLLISLAVTSLIATFYVWFLDGVLLNPSKVIPALKDAGVPAEIANILPDKATQDGDGTAEEKAEMKAKIANIVTADYINEKMTAIATSVTTFMKQGTPQPVIDVSDFPAKLRASGVEVGNDIDKNFKDPIKLNEDGKLDKLPQAYKSFKLLKIAGVVLFLVLLGLEWLVAEKGQKLRRTGRIFLHASIWFFTFWLSTVFLPAQFAPKLKNGLNDQSVHGLIDSVIKAIQTLFGQYFLFAAISFGIIALSLYLLRHARKHTQAIKDVSAAAAKQKALPNKR